MHNEGVLTSPGGKMTDDDDISLFPLSAGLKCSPVAAPKRIVLTVCRRSKASLQRKPPETDRTCQENFAPVHDSRLEVFNCMQHTEAMRVCKLLQV